MKKFKLLIICALLFSCSPDSDSDTQPPEELKTENKAPTAPLLSIPEDNLFCVENNLDFGWLAATDPEGDNITYIIEISTTSNFENLFYKRELSSLTTNKEVAKGQNYYWRVIAKDDKGNKSAYSAIRNFYTEEEPDSNSIPSVPKMIKPEEYKVYGSEIELAWESIDADGDELQFDLYFGTSEKPALLKENLTQNLYVVNNLEAGQIYYWQVVVKDGSGGKTIGQVWSFQAI